MAKNFCSKCGEKLNDGAKFCSECGAPVAEGTDKGKAKANEHEQFASYTALAAILPFVGFIVGIVYMTKERRVDKKLGEHMLVTSIIFGIVWVLVLNYLGLNNQVY